MVVRPSAVAGQFYPGDADRLRKQVSDLLANIAMPFKNIPQAIIVPLLPPKTTLDAYFRISVKDQSPTSPWRGRSFGAKVDPWSYQARRPPHAMHHGRRNFVRCALPRMTSGFLREPNCGLPRQSASATAITGPLSLSEPAENRGRSSLRSLSSDDAPATSAKPSSPLCRHASKADRRNVSGMLYRAVPVCVASCPVEVMTARMGRTTFMQASCIFP